MSIQLSIGVPSYNVEKYLNKGLSSYCDERLEGLVEVIVVNDGSTDATHEIAESYVERMPKVFRLIDKENGGHGSAVNAAMRAAKGRYFRVIDADDWATTDDLVKFAHELERIDTDLVCDVKREVDMATRKPTLFPLPEDCPLGTPVSFETAINTLDLESLVMIHTLTIKRDLIERIGLTLLEHTFYVDYEYVVKATLAAADITFLDLNVYNYLVGNATQSVADASYVKRYDDHARVTREICELYQGRSRELAPVRAQYLLRRAALICNTHYNIALIFDHDRRRGKERAQAFHQELHDEFPDIAKATEKRYHQDLILHRLGIDSQEKLDRISGR